MVALRGGHGAHVLVSFSLFLALVAADAARAVNSPAPPVPGRLVLRARGGLATEALQRVLNVAGARRIESVNGVEGTVVEADPGTLLAVADSLRRSGLFSSVERDQRVRIAEPNDTYYQSQWALPRGGVPAAWALSSGAGVTVAVVDTGVDASHPDLRGQLLPGYDFLNDDPYPNDDNGHGTRMSGIVGAACNNGEGICGVAPGAMVLPIKSLDAQGYGPYSAVANGIVYAVDHGARVVNLSLVGTAPSSILQAAVDYAAAHDVIVVAAAGNFGTDVPGYPAASSGAVAVAAINDADGHPSFSNSGPWVSVSAPGVDVVTTSPGGYATSTGTSPAAAFSSGVFALLLAANPALNRADAIARVQAGAVDLGASGWDPYFGWGRVDAYGALVPGQVGAPPPDGTPPTISILSPTKGSLQSNMVAVDVAANDNVAIGRVELFVDNRWYATMTAPPYSFVIDAGKMAAGDHKLRAYAYDTSNNVAKTRNVKVSFTPGTGLLVTHTVVKASSVSVSGKFALPADVAFNPSMDDVVVTLSSADGTILSAVAKAGSFNVSGSGKMQGIMSPSVPSTGSVRLTAKGDVGDQPLYTFKLRASNLSGMSARHPLMNLGIAVGGIQLSQSLPCRAKGSTFLYP